MKFLFLVLLVALVGAQDDYCKICSDHTKCRFPTDKLGEKCNTGRAAATSDQQIKDILNRHNELRLKVAKGDEKLGKPGPQPKAKLPLSTSMPNMTWNTELAEIAQRWADQCNYTHDSCRNTKQYYVGQNIYKGSSSRSGQPPNFIEAINLWYGEVKDFEPKNIKPFVFTYQTGHYTQVLWAKTTEVGCGFSQYTEGKWYNSQIVCNYGPGGNMKGATMYERA